MEDFESASADFQAAVHMNPDYADGYYNLGSLYLILKKEDDAQEMLEKAISLKPENHDYHGALAAAYAELGEADMFFMQLEQALEKGFDIHKYPQAFSAYRDDVRFKELAARYR